MLKSWFSLPLKKKKRQLTSTTPLIGIPDDDISCQRRAKSSKNGTEWKPLHSCVWPGWSPVWASVIVVVAAYGSFYTGLRLLTLEEKNGAEREVVPQRCVTNMSRWRQLVLSWVPWLFHKRITYKFHNKSCFLLRVDSCTQKWCRFPEISRNSSGINMASKRQFPNFWSLYMCAPSQRSVSEGDLFFFFFQRCCSFERRLPSYMCFFCKYAGRESSRCQDAACQVSISKSVAVRHVTARQTGIVKRKPFDPVRKTIPDASSAFDWTARVLRHAAHTQPLRQYRVAHGSH